MAIAKNKLDLAIFFLSLRALALEAHSSVTLPSLYGVGTALPVTVFAVLGAWRVSLFAGAMGAAASAGWFTAFAMRNVADVRALGLIEVLFSYAIARRMFGERTTALEATGMALLIAGLAMLCQQF